MAHGTVEIMLEAELLVAPSPLPQRIRSTSSWTSLPQFASHSPHAIPIPFRCTQTPLRIDGRACGDNGKRHLFEVVLSTDEALLRSFLSEKHRSKLSPPPTTVEIPWPNLTQQGSDYGNLPRLNNIIAFLSPPIIARIALSVIVLQPYHQSSPIQPLPILRRKKQWSSSHGIAIGVYE
ncbi:hypothetical protein M422DRAFT_259733 [Sphaerobolus stellatus SS14]|uniref:Uncharacterized protein n=1 Tax=Sphaerobolus stellatus (strain SS14) TaxID=990650 RepID=A0A0C9U3Y3_SPHS4|nr:hypothetical protein M422DRAFT_259733 [Sphaerobolus stellatus SS14]